MPLTRRQRTGRTLLVGVPMSALALGFAVLLVVQIGLDQAGCGSVDPTDPGNYSEVSILAKLRLPRRCRESRRACKKGTRSGGLAHDRCRGS